MNRITTVAAAVAAALSGGAAMAQPSLSQIQTSTNIINIMGSSAIKTALLNTIENTFCGGTYTPITAGGTSSNFIGVACVPASGQATNAGSVYDIMIRYEGGSVSGYLPIVNGKGVNELQPSGLQNTNPQVNGASTGNGTDDSFTCGNCTLVKVLPDFSIGDVEPKALIGNNYPTAYSVSAWGPVNTAGMFGLLGASPLVDEVYALFVNESSGFTESPLNLTQQTVASILTHKVTNWSQVVDTAGNSVGSGAITIVNREQGSGSRAATDILIAGDGCGSAGSTSTLFNKSGATQYFATGDVLSAANSIAGAITYATIDNNGSKANLVMVNLNGVTPSNLNAALGTYPFWVEAQYINNAAATGADSAAINNIAAALQAQATTAAIADINVIPNVLAANGGGTTHFNTVVHANPNGNGVVPSGGGTSTVYINPFSRGGVTCAAPVDLATQL